MKLETGDILHCRGRRLLSRLIMRFTKSRKSHTAIVVECWGQLYVVDAQRRGVNPTPLYDWHKHYGYEITVSRDLNLSDKKALSIKSFSKVGLTRYDISSLFIIYPIYLFTGKWIAKKSKDDNKNYCSDYVAWVKGFDNYWKMSPEDVYQRCLKDSMYLTFSYKIES